MFVWYVVCCLVMNSFYFGITRVWLCLFDGLGLGGLFWLYGFVVRCGWWFGFGVCLLIMIEWFVLGCLCGGLVC